MATFLVSAVLAVCLLPDITIGDRREARAAAAYGARAMLTLYGDIGGENIMIVNATTILIGIGEHLYRSRCSDHDCESENHLFHCSVP